VLSFIEVLKFNLNSPIVLSTCYTWQIHNAHTKVLLFIRLCYIKKVYLKRNTNGVFKLNYLFNKTNYNLTAIMKF